MHVLWANSALRDASTHRHGWLVLGLLAAVGCNSGRQLQTDLYQRELRLQEDEIYRLEDCLEEYQAIVRDYRCELAELKQAEAPYASASSSPTIAPRPDALPEVPEPLDLGPPVTTDDITPDASGLDPADLDPTDLDVAPAFNKGASEAPPFEGAQLGTDDATRSIAQTNDPQDASAIVVVSADRGLNNQAPLTPPHPYPHATVAEPLAAASIPLASTIELRADSGPDQTLVARVTDASAAWLETFEGEASVMLTDPSVEGRMRRIARWDFTTSEVLDAVSFADNLKRTAELALPIALPAETPTQQPLRLWIRLVDARGNKTLQATTVRFEGDPVRLANSEGLAAAPRRLPAADGALRQLIEPIEVAVAETIESSSEADAWRPARSTRQRRVDPAIQTVTFEAPADRVW